MRLSRTSGVRPMASRMLLQSMKFSRAPSCENIVLGLCHNSFSLACSLAVTQPGEAKGDSFGTREYFERDSVGADCGVFEGRADRKCPGGIGDYGYRAGRQDRGGGRRV